MTNVRHLSSGKKGTNGTEVSSNNLWSRGSFRLPATGDFLGRLTGRSVDRRPCFSATFLIESWLPPLAVPAERVLAAMVFDWEHVLPTLGHQREQGNTIPSVVRGTDPASLRDLAWECGDSLDRKTPK